MASPFIWGSGGEQLTPESAARKRKIAEALLARSGTPAQNVPEGLADIGSTLSGIFLNKQADEAELAGRSRAGELYANLATNTDPNAIIAALTNPDSAWASPSQTSIASALLSSGLERSDPAYQLDMQLKQAQLAAAQAPAQPDYPTSVEEFLFAQDNPDFAAWQAQQPSGQTINVGGDGQRMGTVPPGFAAVQDPTNPSGYRLEPIPGGPAAAEMASAATTAETAGGRKDLAAGIIMDAAEKARTMLNSGSIVAGTPGAVAAMLPESDAAELRRQIDVMKANATIENLTAMRQASPTGGALGSVTEKEGAMLAAASGAIDPNSSPAQLAAAIDNYERTLLQVVHGPDVGLQIYEETRAKPVERSTANGITFKVLP